MRITISNGWVDFREPEDVPEKLRRRVTLLASRASNLNIQEGDTPSNDDMQFYMDFNDAVAMCLIEQWGWDYPVTLEGLQSLPGRVYDEIIKYTQGMVMRLLPSFAVDTDPKAPTVN
jgi:hypothetical protein